MKRVLSCGWLALLLALPVFAQPEILLEETGVEVSVEPGGRLVLLSVEQHSQNGVGLLRNLKVVLEDEDQDGWVSPEIEHAISWYSTWLAISLESGEYAIATPPGFEPRLTEFPEEIRPGAAHLATALRYANLLVVRPGKGAWLAQVADGNPADLEPGRGVAQELEAFEGLGDPPPATLRTLKPQDVVAALDYHHQRIAITTVDPSGGSE